VKSLLLLPCILVSTITTFGQGVVVDGPAAISAGALATSSTAAQISSAPTATPVPITATTVTATTAVAAPKVNGVVYVDGTVYPRTDAGIQSAINAAAATGSEVFLTAGTYSLCSNLPIKITSPTSIVGAGQSAAILSVCSTVPSTTNVLWIQPQTGASLNGFSFTNFAIIPAFGTPAQYGFFFDGSLGQVWRVNISDVYMGGFNGQAIYCSGTGAGQGNLGLSEIGPRNGIVGGILCNSAGDTLKIDHNLISGSNVGIDINNISGSSTLLISDNNIQTAAGAIHLGSTVTGAMIFNNEMEAGAGATGSNGALVDLDGASGASEITGTVLHGNKYQITGGTINGLRINNAANTNISGEYFERGGSPAIDIVPTANAIHTFIGTSVWASGGPLSSMIAGGGSIGTDTKAAFFDNSGNFNLIGSGIFSWNNPSSCGSTIFCINGAGTFVGGFQINGSISGYSNGELTLGGGVGGTDAISDTATSAPTMAFDHRGTGNTGAWMWRSGSGAETIIAFLQTDFSLATAGAGVVLKDSGGACWRITAAVSTGALTSTSTTCPH